MSNIHYLSSITSPMRGEPKRKSACGKTLRPNHVDTEDRAMVTCVKCAAAIQPKKRGRWS